MKKAILSSIAAALFVLTACTHPISKEVRQSADPGVDLEQVRENPSIHEGRTLLLGGLIVGNKTSSDGTELEIFSYRLDLSGQPSGPREREGRFLAKTTEFLDPVLFAKNRMVTLAGTVEGVVTRPLGSKEYRYPVVRIREIHLWPKEPPVPPYDFYPYRPWPYFGPFYPDWYYRDWYYRDYYRRRYR